MTDYCLVQNGAITRQPGPLPTDYAGILNFHLYAVPEEHGWLPVVYGKIPAHDPYTEAVSATMSVVNGKVHVAYRKRGMTVNEINALWPVPTQVSAAQACIVLHDDGLLDELEAVVAASPREVQIWFNRSATWERSSPTLASLAAIMHLSDAALDNLFRRAGRT